MNILLIGSGGREHALAWKMAQSPLAEKIYCAPGNPGIASLEKGACVSIAVKDFEALNAFIREKNIGLTVVGPEDPLAAGAAEALASENNRVFGPVPEAARLEASKTFAKAFMARHNIPTAGWRDFDNADDAVAYIHAQGAPLVVKADGLAAGKGVTVAHDIKTAEEAVRAAMLDGAFGDAGAKVVIEECLIGEEASILAFCDGKTVVPMVTSQDHKPVYDNDAGPNTGGMGAYSPAPVVTPELETRIRAEILEPCLRGMAEEGAPYTGILYAGLMITEAGPEVIEFNVRFGDPETQVVLPRMKSDIVPVFLACCEGALDRQVIEYDERPCVTIVMASGGYPGSYEKGKEITGIEEAESEEGVMVFQAGTRIENGRLFTNGGRVLNVTATAGDLPAAIEKAYAAVGKIHFDQAHYRNDIGQKALKRLK
jgi:phosphoribosylamine---glycine ligase